MAALKEHGLYCKASKCVLGAKEVAFLGHVVSGQHLKADTIKTESVRDRGRDLRQ